MSNTDMTNDPSVALASLRRTGNDILHAFIRDTPATRDDTISRERAWAAELIEALRPFGDHTVSLFEPLGSLSKRELRTVSHIPELDSEHGMSRACHAARCYRLQKLIARLPVVTTQQAIKQESAIPKKLSDRAEVQCRQWLIEEMKKPKTPDKHKDRQKTAAFELFGDHRLSARAFDRAWDRARDADDTHPSWRNRGPARSFPQ